MSNIEKHRAFIDSLEGEKGLPEKFYRLLEPGKDILRDGDEWLKGDFTWEDVASRLLDKILPMYEYAPICRRLESRQIPDLKERVKELVRDAMDSAKKFHTQIINGPENGDKIEDLRDKYIEFLALCEPEKDSKEVKP